MKVRNYRVLFLSALAFTSLFVLTNEEVTEGKEWLKAGLNLFEEQINKSQKKVANLTDLSSNKLKSLFFAGNDSQYVDVKGIALNSLEKTKEGLQASQDHVKNMFFDGKDSQLIDVKDLTSNGLEMGKVLANQGLETGKESVGKIKDMFFNGDQSKVANVESIVDQTKNLVKVVPEKTTSTIEKVVNWFKGIWN